MKRRWRNTGWSISGVIIIGFCLAANTTWLRDGLALPLVSHVNPRPADVIIVLGAGTRKTGERLPSQAKQRTLEGIKLYQQGYAPRIIISGGRDKNTGYVESDEMAKFAVANGLPAEAIIAERQSTSTWENAKYSLAIMQERGWKSAVVVTSPYHTWRACRMFHRQQVNVSACVPAPYALLPTDSSYVRLTDTRSVIREYGAIVYAWVQRQL